MRYIDRSRPGRASSGAPASGPRAQAPSANTRGAIAIGEVRPPLNDPVPLPLALRLGTGLRRASAGVLWRPSPSLDLDRSRDQAATEHRLCPRRTAARCAGMAGEGMGDAVARPVRLIEERPRTPLPRARRRRKGGDPGGAAAAPG